jgi:hypothetical protein
MRWELHRDPDNIDTKHEIRCRPGFENQEPTSRLRWFYGTKYWRIKQVIVIVIDWHRRVWVEVTCN